MCEPKVTVAVPIYNVEKYMDRCLQSLVDQNYKNLEIILVDDGSTDGCPAKCDDWAKRDDRITVVHKTNQGLGMARNTGLDNATGKYIFFIDSDDYVSTQIVEMCVAAAEKDGSDAVIYGRTDVYPDGSTKSHPVKGDKTLFKGAEVRDELLPAMMTYAMGFGVSAWGKMYNLDRLKQLNKRFVSEREIISEDTYFAVDFFADCKVATVLPEGLYYYFKRDDSLSRRYNPQRRLQNDVFYEKTAQLIAQKGLSDKILASVAVRYHMYSIADMKQIICADISKSQKKTALKGYFDNGLLHSTLTEDSLNMEDKNSKIFWKLFKSKRYLMCRLLLWYKAR